MFDACHIETKSWSGNAGNTYSSSPVSTTFSKAPKFVALTARKYRSASDFLDTQIQSFSMEALYTNRYLSFEDPEFAKFKKSSDNKTIYWYTNISNTVTLEVYFVAFS